MVIHVQARSKLIQVVPEVAKPNILIRLFTGTPVHSVAAQIANIHNLNLQKLVRNLAEVRHSQTTAVLQMRRPVIVTADVNNMTSIHLVIVISEWNHPGCIPARHTQTHTHLIRLCNRFVASFPDSPALECKH